MDSITITKNDLQRAFTTWEAAFRAGETRPHEEAVKLPLNQKVSESADYVWGLLTALAPTAS